MKNTFFLFLCIYLLLSCQLRKKNRTNSVDAREKLSIGDYLIVNQEGTQLEALILDSYEEGGKDWLSFCFLNKGKIFGRQVPNGQKGDCVESLDMISMELESLKEYNTLKKFDLNMGEIKMGVATLVRTQKELIPLFEYGLKQRKKKQTPCTEFLLDLDAVRECYFEVDKILAN